MTFLSVVELSAERRWGKDGLRSHGVILLSGLGYFADRGWEYGLIKSGFDMRIMGARVVAVVFMVL